MGDPVAGRLLGEEEPVIVENIWEEGKVVPIAPHAHPAGAGKFALATPTPIEDFESLAETRQHRVTVCGSAPVRPVDDAVGTRLMAESWIARGFTRDARVSGRPCPRAPAPARYRALIVAVAEQVLRDGINGEANQADSNEALRAAYPEWFAQPGCAANTCHQRFRRARADTRELLKAVVNRDELLP